jgi:hypothetical protein
MTIANVELSNTFNQFRTTTNEVIQQLNSASSSNGVSTIVARDASGSFTTNGITATSVSAPTLTGVASVATVSNTATLTADNTTNATNYLTFVNAATGNQALRTDIGLSFNPSTNTLTTTTFSGAFSGSGAALTSIPNSATTASASNGASTIVARDTAGSFAVNTVTASYFTGDGSNLTNLNASNVSSGTLPTARLATSGVSSGGYGNSNAVPQIVVDTYGRVTSASNVSINGINQFNYHSGNANFQITTPSGSSYTASIGQHLGTSANVTFQQLTVSGNLTVTGTTTTISANNLAVKDNLIYLNNESSNTNVDLGFAGNYNDGVYRHAGLFRDADDGVWKFFDRYTLEPDASANLDTSHVSFRFAALKTGDVTSNGTFYGPLTGVAAVATVANTVTLTSDDSTNATRYLTFVDATSGNEDVRTDSGLTYNPSTGLITATQFSGSGATLTNIPNSATTASASNGASTIVARDASGSFTTNGITATSVSAPTLTGVAAVATVSNTSTLTADNTTNATNYLTFVNSATGNQALRTDIGLTFNPSTNTITTTAFAGSGASLTNLVAANIDSGSLGSGVLPYVNTSSTSSAFKVPFVNHTGTTAGNYALLQDSAATFTYNPSTDTLTAGTFSGSGASLTSIPNSATTASSSNGASTIVARDGAGAFAAGAITATTIAANGGGLTFINASNITGGILSNSVTTASNANGASTIVARNAAGAFAAGAISATSVTATSVSAPTLTGVAAVATVANTVTLTADDSTNATRYLTFVDATTGNEDVRTDSGLTYNPSTGLITATQFSGSGATLTNIPNSATTASASNGASTIVARDATGSFTTNGITATTVSAPTLTGVAAVATVSNTATLTADNTTNATNYLTFVNAATGNQALRTDLGLSFNPSTNTLTTTTFSGAFSGSGASLTSIPNSATTASSSNGASTIVARDAGGNFTANNITAANLTTSGIATLNSQTVFNSFMKEKANVSASAATSIINFDAVTAPVLYYTANSTGNFYLNVRGNSTNTLNSLTANNESISIAFLATQGATAYYHLTNIQIDGTNNSIRWQGGSAPTSGNINGIDGYAFTIIKTGNATYTVLGSQTQFKA